MEIAGIELTVVDGFITIILAALGIDRSVGIVKYNRERKNGGTYATRDDIHTLHSDLKLSISETKAEIKQEIGSVKAEIKEDVGEVNTKIDSHISFHRGRESVGS